MDMVIHVGQGAPRPTVCRSGNALRSSVDPDRVADPSGAPIFSADNAGRPERLLAVARGLRVLQDGQVGRVGGPAHGDRAFEERPVRGVAVVTADAEDHAALKVPYRRSLSVVG